MRRLALLSTLCLFVAAIAGVGAVSNGGQRVLVVEDAATGERLLAAPVAEGTSVALDYAHGGAKTPVRDAYSVEGTKLELVRMEFRSYGKEPPTRADVTVTENGTVVYRPERVYDHVYVKSGRPAVHRLVVGDRTYDLVALSDARSVRLSVVRRSALASAVDDLAESGGLSTASVSPSRLGRPC